MFYKNFKRIFDLIFSASGLVLSIPILLLIALISKFSMGDSIIFSQPRPGLNGKVFRMYKFRTMIPPNPDEPMADQERITPFGKWLRATSLDEVPELLNVIKGEMSLVGPRPLLVDYLPLYTQREMVRHNVLPGITGLAQVRGRNNLSWKNKFRYDIFYAEKANFMFDLQILYETISTVFFRKGFRSHGEERRFDE